MAHQVEVIQQIYGAYCNGLTQAAQGLLQVAFHEARQGARGGPEALANASAADLADEPLAEDLMDTDSCTSDDSPACPAYFFEDSAGRYRPNSSEDESSQRIRDLLQWHQLHHFVSFDVPASNTKLHHLKMADSVAWPTKTYSCHMLMYVTDMFLYMLQ